MATFLLASWAVLAVSANRLSVNFDFAWRFAQGVEPRLAQCTFEQGVNYSNFQRRKYCDLPA